MHAKISKDRYISITLLNFAFVSGVFHVFKFLLSAVKLLLQKKSTRKMFMTLSADSSFNILNQNWKVLGTMRTFLTLPAHSEFEKTIAF
jgi:hypothetical protein